MTIWCGIDPGAKGGITLLSDKGELQIYPMPENERFVARLFENRMANAGIKICMIERVHAMPKNGVVSTAHFMLGYGIVRGMLLAHKIEFHDIDPRSWMKALGIPPRIKAPTGKNQAFMNFEKPETTTEWKKRLHKIAMSLFPSVDIPFDQADSVLIAEVARRVQA